MKNRYAILGKRILAPGIKEMEIYAPRIARAVMPGQFIMIIVNERGKRIPLTLVLVGIDQKVG